jgi:hypothetical protein
VFQRAYAIEPLAFCRYCHAPLGPRGVEPTGVAAEEGISCSVCHVRDGVVLSSGEGRGDAPGTVAPHPVQADARFRESAYCAGCHQFNFPAERSRSGALYDPGEPLQDTFEEWRRSTHAQRGTQCQDCHMPWRTAADGTRYRAHTFNGTRDPSLLAQAARVHVRAERRSDGAVLVRAAVIATGVGHAFPTGDLFRRLELSLWLDDDTASTRVITFARMFADRYETARDGSAVLVRREVGDSRVQPPSDREPRESTLVFRTSDRTLPTRVRWRLEHLLMPSTDATVQGFSEHRYRTVVAQGEAAVRVEATSSTH